MQLYTETEFDALARETHLFNWPPFKICRFLRCIVPMLAKNSHPEVLTCLQWSVQAQRIEHSTIQTGFCMFSRKDVSPALRFRFVIKHNLLFVTSRWCLCAPRFLYTLQAIVFLCRIRFFLHLHKDNGYETKQLFMQVNDAAWYLALSSRLSGSSSSSNSSGSSIEQSGSGDDHTGTGTCARQRSRREGSRGRRRRRT